MQMLTMLVGMRAPNENLIMLFIDHNETFFTLKNVFFNLKTVKKPF